MSFLTKQKNVNLNIPGNDKKGVTDAIKFFSKTKVDELEVRVNIAHPNSGELELLLKAPSGKSIKLQGRSKKKAKNLVKVFKGSDLKKLNGEKAQGDWKLTVVDGSKKSNAGTLQSWSIRANCQNIETSEIFIPDNKSKTLVSQQMCDTSGKVKSVEASIDIKHSYIGDLQVKLVAPSGKSVVLHNREGKNKKNLKKKFSAKDLTALVGEKSKGIWNLEVNDKAKNDNGKINSWHVDLVVG